MAGGQVAVPKPPVGSVPETGGGSQMPSMTDYQNSPM